MASITPIIWIHGDCLSPQNPLFRRHPHAPALFVWDDAYLQRAGISLKRILFIYECLLALPVIIRRGDVAAELIRFAGEQEHAHIITIHSPSPGFARISRRLQEAGLQLDIIPPEPFVTLPEEIDLKRFSRYWRHAQKQLS